jgi:BirA family biotin operon repressor/biotin-[acetyl-CoA-carboxylase] ligase
VSSGADAARTIRLQTVDSTNAEALRLAASGEAGPLWIRADAQTGGRGRQGKPWVSEPGNLYCSALLAVDLSTGAANGLSFVAALAVYDSVAELLIRAGAGADLKLKWPNDVLLDGAKLSGILLEATSAGAKGVGAMAVGIGINVAHHPDLADARTICLADVGAAVPVDDVFALLRETFARWFEEWNGGEGFALVRDAWLMRARGIGEAVHVNLPNERLTGTFVGLDDGGAMILREATGQERRVFAGDLFFDTAGHGGSADE